jgi:hypothetical protein
MAHQKEIIALAQNRQADLGKNRESNLFDPKRDYLMSDSPLEQSIYIYIYMMLITSQSNTPPKIGKNTKTEMIQGVQVAMFRISDENINALFGSAVLPALNPKDVLAQ